MSESPLPPWPVRPALFLDLDGTLVEIAAEPRHARPSARLRALLPALRKATDGAVALVSGRPLADLDRLLAPHNFVAAGIHGIERRNGHGRVVAVTGNRAALAAVRERIASFVSRHEGLLLEDKGQAVALHYRRRPDLEHDVRRFTDEIGEGLSRDLELLRGRMVVEIKTRGANKGDAIATFMREPPFVGRTAVFVGDDVTDEAGFEVVNALGGVSVKVNDGKTVARWRLACVDDVLGWLEGAVEGSLR